MADTPIVIIGAGLAGLGAAALCRDHGRRAVVLEASGGVTLETVRSIGPAVSCEAEIGAMP